MEVYASLYGHLIKVITEINDKQLDQVLPEGFYIRQWL